MNEINFSALDLNLLRVFDGLVEERSATRAGERLGLSQSAVSHALNRLRHLLKDELFVRGPDGMQPTPLAAEIAPRVRQGLLQLQLALAPPDFVPERASRRFTVACSDYISAILLPGAIARLHREAPRVQLRVLSASMGLAEELDAGRIDLAIGSFGRIPERFASETLFHETLVWVLRADHPVARGPMTLERLAGLSHLIIAVAGEDAETVDGVLVDRGLERRVMVDDAGALSAALAARGLRRVIGLTLPHALAVPCILGRSDMAALLPRRLATAFARHYGLKLVDPPYPSPPLEVRMLWHRGHGHLPAITWLGRLLREAAATGADRPVMAPLQV